MKALFGADRVPVSAVPAESPIEIAATGDPHVALGVFGQPGDYLQLGARDIVVPVDRTVCMADLQTAVGAEPNRTVRRSQNFVNAVAGVLSRPPPVGPTAGRPTARP